jgi:hypothetical protein
MRPATPIHAALIALLALLLAACGSAAGSPAPTDAPNTPVPSLDAPSPSAPPSPLAPAEPSDGPAEPSPVIELSDVEQQLLERIRPDARERCAPRREDLPDGATAGVECQPAEGVAARVGMYQFATDQDAARAYFARFADEGVAARSGDCRAGIEGEGAWTPGDDRGEISGDAWDGVEIDGVAYRVFRDGCFENADGVPNYRATCGNGLYVGVLGRTGDLRELVAWSWENAPDAPVNTPGAPGICYYPEV